MRIKLSVILPHKRHIEKSRGLLHIWGRACPSAELAMEATTCRNEADDQVQHPAARHPVSQVHIEGTSRITEHLRTILAERLAHNGSSKALERS